MKNKSPIIEGPLGGLPGSGRTPKALQLKNYSKVLKLLDDSVEEAFAVLREGLQHPEIYARIRCAEIILKKYLPDKKIKEIGGIGGGPIEVTNTDKRVAVMAIVDMLDNHEIDEIRKKASDGDFRLFEHDSRGENQEEKEMGGKEETDS